ncbi:hypothetical protein WJX81_002891 [Elliptochloris bilobata]|uniref:Ribonuclease M5 C-terminal domain-containing protein n=1 Tax=Elliptochloris bilobata TaxID=381761 RepID=A0AAW1SKJ9_9CHLO
MPARFRAGAIGDVCASHVRRRHKAGNVGVEHAAPDALRAALSHPRESAAERAEFSRDDLHAWGLAGPRQLQSASQDASLQQNPVRPAALRRRLLCAQLGIGDCDGKQLLRVLNRFSFSRPEVLAALDT